MIARFFTLKGLAIAGAVSLALGAFGGWTVNGWRLQGRIDRIEKSYAEASRLAEERARNAERKAAEASAEADQKAVEIVERIRVETRTITKEVPVYVSPEVDTRFALPAGLVRLHDHAATGDLSGLSDAARDPDAASGFAEPSPVKASEFGTAIVENYGTCRANQARLNALQNWLLEQRDIYEAR